MLEAIKLENRESYWAMAFAPPLIRQPTMQRVLVTTASSEEPLVSYSNLSPCSLHPESYPPRNSLSPFRILKSMSCRFLCRLFIACVWVSFMEAKQRPQRSRSDEHAEVQVAEGFAYGGSRSSPRGLERNVTPS